MRFLVMFFVIIGMVQSCGNGSPKFVESENFEWVELSDGVYSCIHKFGGKAICNVGIVDNGKETVIFDSFISPRVADELVDAVEKMGLSPVKYVVNSHFHNDHIRGNQAFASSVNIVSTSITKQLIEQEEPLQIAYEKENAPARFAYYDSLYQTFTGDKQSREYLQILLWRPYYEILSNSHLEVQTRVPDLVIDSALSIDGPLRRIQLISKGEGHTESDLVMYLPDDEILFTGDLVFNDCHPYVAHGNISKWKSWLSYLNSLGVQTVMPGHGNIGTKALIGQMKTYLEDLEQAARDLIEQDIAPETMDHVSIPDQYELWWFDRFYATNLAFAHQSLTAVATE